jgi:hypothetical protein
VQPDFRDELPRRIEHFLPCSNSIYDKKDLKAILKELYGGYAEAITNFEKERQDRGSVPCVTPKCWRCIAELKEGGTIVFPSRLDGSNPIPQEDNASVFDGTALQGLYFLQDSANFFGRPNQIFSRLPFALIWFSGATEPFTAMGTVSGPHRWREHSFVAPTSGTGSF